MRKLLFLIALLFGIFTVNGQSVSQQLFIDFGPNDVTNGNITINPDANGNYWNNPTLAGVNSSLSLINTANAATGFTLSVATTGFTTNGILNGGLLAPDATKLGNMAIATATQDYFYTTTNGTLKISGLSVSKTYKFYLFASRDYAGVRTSAYTLTGSNSCTGTLQSSGTDLGGTGKNGNNSSFYTSDALTPNASGEISIYVAVSAGGFAYVNMMKIEEINASQVDATFITIAGGNISSSAASQMSVVYTPANATPHIITWSVDDSSIASISSSGLLTPQKNGTVTVTASFVQNGQTISATKQIVVSNQTNELYISGSATSNGDNQLTALQMNPTYGISGLVAGVFELATTLNATGTLKFYTSRTDVNAPSYGAGATAGTILIGGSALTLGVSGPVLIRVYLTTNTYKIYPINEMKISQMGSSVSYGTGATSNHGYAWMYGQLLGQRFSSGMGMNWTLSNISVGGNTTIDLLNRWDSDLLNDGSKYVVYALSLGNEGILTGGQPIFDQFKKNMLLLISKARSVGKIPIVTNVYPRGDYGATQYAFVKQMNLLINDWDVPSINMLGAIDDGAGKWPTYPVNYQFDTNHPNDAGHVEIFYALVPSLFDALKVGKPLPLLKTNTYLSSGKSTNSDKLVFTPENIIHPFTISIDVKTTSTGTITSFKQGTDSGTVGIDASGVVTYTSPSGAKIIGTVVINDGSWHKITLTHYYAWGETILYSDKLETGRLTEKLTATDFYLNDITAPESIDYRNWFFYRSGMNTEDISALCSGKMLKSSLELYAPLDGQQVLGTDTIVNLAQSTNTIKRIQLNTGFSSVIQRPSVKVFPNPVADILSISGMDAKKAYNCSIYSVDGRLIRQSVSISNNQINVSDLKTSKYVLRITDTSRSEKITLSFQKTAKPNK